MQADRTPQRKTRWYRIRRTYRVEDAVYVEAASATDARQKAWDFEYDFVTDPETISDTRWGRAKPIGEDELPSDLAHYALYGEWPR